MRLVSDDGAPGAAIGMFIAAIWAAAKGDSAVTGINGTFAGFWLSYAVLVLGLTTTWFGIASRCRLSFSALSRHRLDC